MNRVLASILVLLLVFEVVQTLKITELAEYVKGHKDEYQVGSVIEVEGYPKLVVTKRAGETISLGESCGGTHSSSVFNIQDGEGVIDELSGKKGCSGSQQAAVYHQFGVGWGIRQFTLLDLADLTCVLGEPNPDHNHHGTGKVWVMLSGDGTKLGTYAGKSFAVNYGGKEYSYTPAVRNLAAIKDKAQALRNTAIKGEIENWLKKAAGSGCGSMVDTIISKAPQPVTLSAFAKALSDYASTEGIDKKEYCSIFYQFINLFTGYTETKMPTKNTAGRPVLRPAVYPLINVVSWAVKLPSKKRRRFK